MNAQTMTVISGFVLLFVFVLVSWNLRRRGGSHEREDRRSPEGKP